ncbi:MAG: TauD/TfdA family dioxygenase [Pseudomonadota bacterium]
MELKDLPERITGPGAWLGPDMATNPDRWLGTLTDDEIADLRRAAAQFAQTGKDVGQITAADFPVTAVAARINALRNTLANDSGIAVWRGLPTDQMDIAEAATIFCGVGAHIGPMRSQNAAGHVLGHVRDTGADPKDTSTRIYQTAARQTFHTDSADVVGLLCLQNAREGGDSLLVSAESIYNRMRAEAPELLVRLFDPIATDRRGEVPEGMQPYMTIPPLSWHDGKLTVFYQRQYIDSAQRFPEAMRLTADHLAALDMFDALANDAGLHFSMRLEPGDMQFVYNHAQLHDRTGFTDWPDPAQRRHLLRLWLSLPGDRALPDVFRQRYGSITPGDRGGIICPGTELNAPL